MEFYEPGGPVERFQDIASIRYASTCKHRFDKPQVSASTSSLLQVAAAAGERAIVLWGHKNSAMHTASTFWMAVPQAAENENLSNTDTLYVPEVLVYGYSDGLERKLFKRDSLYSKHRSSPDLLQLLRLCTMKGYDELVIESIDLEFSDLLFYDTFLDQGLDVAGCIRKIFFAQCSPDVLLQRLP